MGLRVRDAVVRYEGTTAVGGVSLDVADGEVLALLGPSGCGKSSLLRAVAGLEPLAAGGVAFDGQDLAGVPVHRRGFGLLFQDGQLFAHRDVAGNVAYGLETARVPRAERRERGRELLELVGLAGYERRAVSTLSGGERQRVALARALAPRPRLLLLDEPFSALDRGLRERLAVEVRAILTRTGTTAVFVTHDHDEAFTVADRVAVMGAPEPGGAGSGPRASDVAGTAAEDDAAGRSSGGVLLQVAAPEELWRAPASRRVARFLGYQAFVPLAGPEALPGSDGPGGAGRDGWLAVGPAGLRVLPPDVSEPRWGTAHPGPDRPGGGGAAGGWTGEAVGSVFRRGRTEVTVDVDLGAGVQRLAAVLDGAAGTAGTGAPAPGDKVTVALDPAGCAVVRG
ncbi:ABC transporter ATP-binding protein [Puerhibacterium puerhi]|uniref:ABC transporter ATP-binding protein n=1 Tax=Puerhibacterium puerhi TaxID=2692623 RepID=UPI00135B97D8|nr:ABC transporter ATP-binding protein [Puerhibacterium puerhi]